MAQKLSSDAPIRSGAYKSTVRMFFLPSKLFEAQITELFDSVWPEITAIKNLRWQVSGYYNENNIQNIVDLSKKFVEPSDTNNHPNLYRACIGQTWDEQEFYVTKNLLTNMFAIYEGWIDNMLCILHKDRYMAKRFQYPLNGNVPNYLSILQDAQLRGNQDLVDCFYEIYKTSNKYYDFHKIDNWLKLYRYFKEARNCIIHNGGTSTSQKTIDAYNEIINLTKEDYGVKELPEIIPPVTTDRPIELSLRGVVGFSQILIKLVSTFDVEFIKCEFADEYMLSELRLAQPEQFKTDPNRIRNGVNRLLHKGNFKSCSSFEIMYNLLRNAGLMR